MSGFNPFEPAESWPASRPQQAAREQRRAQRDLIRAAFAPGSQAHAALQLLYQAEQAQPSFQPGQDFASIAWAEGRKAVLHDLLAMLAAPPTQDTEA